MHAGLCWQASYLPRGPPAAPVAPPDRVEPALVQLDELPRPTAPVATDPTGRVESALVQLNELPRPTAPVAAGPRDRAEPALVQLDELPRPTPVLVENPFQLAPPVTGPVKVLTRSGMAIRGEVKDQDLLSKAPDDPEPSPEASLRDLRRFDWEIRKVQVTPEHRPPWQDILK